MQDTLYLAGMQRAEFYYLPSAKKSSEEMKQLFR